MTAPSLSPVTVDQVRTLLERPLLELVLDAARVHAEHHDPARIQCSQLLSIKTGGCPEDCGYCSQSAHHGTPVGREPLMDLETVRAAARAAREGGADRFCMGAAWREIEDGPDFEAVLEMVREVKAQGLEACVTLGMLQPHQAERLREAGLDYYNHNLDTGRSHYGEVIHTRTYDERLQTLDAVREAGIHVCSGGILGMGEGTHARAELLARAGRARPAAGERADQRAGAGRGNAVGRRRRSSTGPSSCAPSPRPDPHAARRGAPERRPDRDGRGGPGHVLPRGRQLDLRGRRAAHHAQPGPRERRRPARQARAAARAVRLAMAERANLDAALGAEMERWEAAGLRRELGAPTTGGADFTSNDYLGLASHPAVVEAARSAIGLYGAGSRASRLLGGGCPLDAQAERACAEWVGSEAALLFPSGYHANLGILGALAGPGDLILSDALNHASLIDGARLSGARIRVYRHLDVEDAERKLRTATGWRRALVVTESTFSMDGDRAPLAALAELCAEVGASLVVDEAHSIGVVGPRGAGGWAELGGDRDDVLAGRVVTGGKALGVSGAFVACSSTMRAT